MSLLVVMVRHGESDANRMGKLVSEAFDPALTQEGHQQAMKFAALWKGKSIDALYASPLLRTRETAEVLRQVWGLSTVQTDDRLHEIRMGSFDGQEISELAHQEVYQEWKKDPELPPEGGERLSAVYMRVRQFLVELGRTRDRGCVLVVTHADCLKAITLGTLEAPWQSSGHLHFENLASIQLEVLRDSMSLKLLPSLPL